MTHEDTTVDGQCHLSRREWAWAFAAAVLSISVKLLTATRRGFWLDEYYTLHAARLPLVDLVMDRLAAGHSPLPFLYAKAFVVALGSGELALKLSSILACGVALLGVVGLVAQLGLKRLLPALLPLLVLHPYWHYIGTELRYMMPLVAVGSFWCWSIVAWLQEQSAARFRVSVLLGAVTLWMHGSAQFLLAALALFAVLDCWRGGPRRIIVGCAPLACSLAIAAPLLIALGMMPRDAASRKLPDPFECLNNQVESYFGEGRASEALSGIPGGAIAVACLLIYVACVVAAFVSLRRERNLRACSFLAAMLIGVPLAAMIYSLLKDNVQGPARYVAMSSVSGAIALALGLTEVARRFRRGILAGGFVLLLVVYTLALQMLDQGDGHREAVKWLAAHRRVDQPVVAIGRGMNLVAFEYYGVPKGGFLDGISSDIRQKAVIKRFLRAALRNADSGFLFQYRNRRTTDEIDGVMEMLRREGVIRAARLWQPTEDIRIIGMATTNKGEEYLASLPEVPAPRFTSNPL